MYKKFRNYPLLNEYDRGRWEHMSYIESIEDTELYKYACTYMALTELYDRRFTHYRSPYNSTEAYIIHPKGRKLSNQYALELKNLLCGEDVELWRDIMNEIHRYPNYSADMWIDEWDRLTDRTYKI